MVQTGSNTGNPAGAPIVKKPEGPYTRDKFMHDLSRVASKVETPKK